VFRDTTLIALAALGLGCGASHLPELTENQPISYRDHVEPLVLERCLSCHTLDEPKAELVLEPGRGYDQLVGRRSVQVPALLLVAPGDAADSYLWRKLDGTASVGDGMPRTLFGTRRLPDRELERFRAWIEDGARP
jgi:hypothetical protein